MNQSLSDLYGGSIDAAWSDIALPYSADAIETAKSWLHDGSRSMELVACWPSFFTNNIDLLFIDGEGRLESQLISGEWVASCPSISDAVLESVYSFLEPHMPAGFDPSRIPHPNAERALLVGDEFTHTQAVARCREVVGLLRKDSPPRNLGDMARTKR